MTNPVQDRLTFNFDEACPAAAGSSAHHRRLQITCGKRRFTLWQTKAYHAPRLSVEAAARLMGVGRRQVYRL
ncbi:MAG: hypothetical protein WAL10_11255, partial [Acetobacteraceae bacterium]